MNRTFSQIMSAALLAAALVSAAGVSTTSARTPGSTPYVYTFDKTTDPWQAGTGVPVPNPLTLNIQRELCPSSTGCNSFAALHSGTGSWMSAAFPAATGSVSVQFQMKDISGCKGCIPVAYVGSKQPSSIHDFQKLGDVMQADAWGFYTLEVAPNNWLSQQMVVAIGYFNNGALSPAVIGVDNIVISTGR